MLNILVIFNILVPFLLADQIDYSAVQPLEDTALEQRLTQSKVYFTKQNDNLVKVAYRVYGHRTWWSKIKVVNPEIGNFGPYNILPLNTRIKYNAPSVGNEYVVQINDTLSRIAEWKYGDLELWKQVYEKNKSAIENPDIIEPGDRLTFENDGTIKKINTGEIIVKGLNEGNKEKKKTSVTATAANTVVNKKDSVSSIGRISRINGMYESWRIAQKDTFVVYKEKILGNKYYLFLISLVLLMIIVFIYITFPRRINASRYSGSPAKHNPQYESDLSFRLHGDELNLRPNYFSLLKKWWKKYLRFHKSHKD